ncbi:MAG: hypothetical protein MI748_18305 [Opitutales bacterium]|nr:hypothetical protein [Opitutales bacterium]
MFTVDINLFVSTGIFIGLGFIAILWIYYDTYGKSIHQNKRDRVIFHCVKCGHVYTAAKGIEEANCPRCQMDNIKLRF